jgi:hypothetical protein
MEENLKKAFLKAKYELKTDLAPSIWQSLMLRNRRIVRLKLSAFSLAGIASLAGIVPVLKILLNDFSQSGFYEYLSVAFSNNGGIASYWRELSFSLAESLPATSILAVLSLVFVFLLSLRYVLKQIINNKYIGSSYAVT